MCDCYTRKCETCEREMDIHIADYCTERKNVHPYCPSCAKKLKKPVRWKDYHKDAAKVFVETLESSGKYCGVQGGRKGQKVVFVCDDPKAHGIHLNA